MAVDRREALLDAAERAILAEGFAGASTRRIAREAAVPLSLLHYHFGGKEGLLVALVERARDRGRDALSGTLAPGEPASVRVAQALAVARREFLEGGSTILLNLELAVAALHSEPLRAEVRRLYSDAIGTLSQTVTTLAVENPASHRAAVRSEAVASLILAAGFGLALQRVLGADARAADDAFEMLGRLLVGRLGDSSVG